MSEQENSVLSFYSTGRKVSNDRDAIVAEYQAMRDEHSNNGKNSHDYAKKLSAVVKNSGTHLLKFTGLTAKTGQAALRVAANGRNSAPELFPAIGAQDIAFAKILYRPIEIEGVASKSLVEHMQEPEDNSEMVYGAFSDVFGEDVLDDIKDALANGPDDIEAIPAKNFPVTFLPNPEGGDLQVSPVMPTEAFVAMQDIVKLFFQEKSSENPKPRRGSFDRSIVSGKMRNICGKTGGALFRFEGRVPLPSSTRSAELYRYAKGGAFPSIKNPFLKELMDSYIAQFASAEHHDNNDRRRGRNNTADAIIDQADNFIVMTMEDAAEISPDATLAAPPTFSNVIMSYPWGKDEKRAEVKKVISTDEFRKRLRRAGGQ